MKGYDKDYNQVSGLDPLAEAIQQDVRGASYLQESIAQKARIQTFFLGDSLGREILTHDDITSVFISTKRLYVILDEKDSKIPHKLAQFLSTRLDKSNGDSQGITMGITMKSSFPEDHIFRMVTGIESIEVQGYLPQTCKLVEYREPVSEKRRKQLEDELENGQVKFKTECTPEEEPETIHPLQYLDTLADPVADPEERFERDWGFQLEQDPGVSHDPDCAQRLHTASECTCSKTQIHEEKELVHDDLPF